MSTNLPTYVLAAAQVTARNAEYTGTPFTDIPGSGTYADPVLGGNKAGSNAPGIGINTGNIDPKLSDWSILDQDEAARDPQLSSHIGGDGTFDGGLPVIINAIIGTDINDKVAYSAADQQAVADAIYDTATGALNKTGVTVEIGDVLWGTVPAV